MSKKVELQQVENRSDVSRAADVGAAGGRAPLATANQAVPLLWLSIFDYEDTEIRSVEGTELFSAVVRAGVAAARAEALAELLQANNDLSAKTFAAAAGEMARALGRLPGERHISLFPLGIFQEMRVGERRDYVKQLVDLASLWQHCREGLSWAESSSLLQRITPGVEAIFVEEDQALASYYLIGSLATQLAGLDKYLVKEGAGEKDTHPQALAVGDQGLVLGRYDGKWKLLSSGSEANLLGAWALEDTAYVVGWDGTIIRFRGGIPEAQEVPSREHFAAVHGFGPKSICVVGDNGTVVAFNGQQWQPWPVPSDAPFHCVWGTSADNMYVAGRESRVLRFDGYEWLSLPLPVDGYLIDMVGNESVVFAAGASGREGLLCYLTSEGWSIDDGLPRTVALRGLWMGWSGEIGVAPVSGNALVNQEGRWSNDPIYAEELIAVKGGAVPMAIGTRGEHSLIFSRNDGVWSVEAAVKGLRLNNLWVAGIAKPPRLEISTAENG